MAKKAKKVARKAAAPKSAPSGNRGVIIGVIVALAVIILLVFLLKGGREAPIAPTGPTGPAEPTEVVQAKPTLTAVTPEFERYCKESTGTTAPTLGYTPCACQIEGDDLNINLLNSGKEDIEGIYFEVTGNDGKTVYFSDFNNIAPKETHKYTLSLNEIASQLGEKVVDLIAHPSQNKKACLNTRIIILSDESCAQACKA